VTLQELDVVAEAVRTPSGAHEREQHWRGLPIHDLVLYHGSR
jgi:hypothetical protein